MSSIVYLIEKRRMLPMKNSRVRRVKNGSRVAKVQTNRFAESRIPGDNLGESDGRKVGYKFRLQKSVSQQLQDR